MEAFKQRGFTTALAAGRERTVLPGGTGRFALMAVSVQSASGGLNIGKPEKLFNFIAPNLLPGANPFLYSAAADGQRFLIATDESAALPTVNVIVNWEQAVAERK